MKPATMTAGQAAAAAAGDIHRGSPAVSGQQHNHMPHCVITCSPSGAA
jgi:hypothetical protein